MYTPLFGNAESFIKQEHYYRKLPALDTSPFLPQDHVAFTIFVFQSQCPVFSAIWGAEARDRHRLGT